MRNPQRYRELVERSSELGRESAVEQEQERGCPVLRRYIDVSSAFLHHGEVSESGTRVRN